MKIIHADSESSPTKASEAANKLVLNDKVDMLVGGLESDNINRSPRGRAAQDQALMENGTMLPGSRAVRTSGRSATSCAGKEIDSYSKPGYG
jgi:ABC-type branched-subunit amino acid transport system substrate-binding protein